MKRFWKKKRFWGSLIAVALLAYCVKDLRWTDLQQMMSRLDLRYLIPAIACAYLFIIAKAQRWRLLVSQHKRIPSVRLTSLYSAGQVLNIAMPALTGQVGRMILFSRYEGLRKTFVFSTIVLEVLFDAVSLVVFLLLTSLAFAFPERYRTVSIVIASLTLAALILLYLILSYRRQLEDLGRRQLRDRWPGTYVTITKFIRSFTKGIEALRSTPHIFGSLALSLFIWATHVLVIYFLLMSFGYELPLAAAASVMIINTIALMIPITPGNAGTFEVAVSTALAAFSVGRSDAVLLAVALHLLDLLPVVTLGAGFLRAEKDSIRRLKSEEHPDVFSEASDNEEDEVVLEREKSA